jgi:hypothetical protein
MCAPEILPLREGNRIGDNIKERTLKTRNPRTEAFATGLKVAPVVNGLVLQNELQFRFIAT